MYPESSEEDIQNMFREYNQIMDVLDGKSMLEVQVILSAVISSILEQMPEEIRGGYIKMVMKASLKCV